MISGFSALAPDFRAIFERLPTPFMILDSRLHYVDLNTAYLEVTNRTRESIIGRYLFDAFPEEGEARRQVEESLRRALETGRPDYLPFIAYRIPRSEALGGGYEERFWSCTHTPICDETGRPAFVMQHTQDITELHLLRQRAADGTPEDAALNQNILRRAESATAQTEETRRLFAAAPGFMAMLRTPDLVFEWANEAYFRLIGRREVIGKSMLEALPELRGQGFEDILASVIANGAPFVGRATPVILQVGEDSRPEKRLLDFIFQPIISARGVVTGVFVQGQDVTEAVRAQEKQRLLLDELNHRVKNTLATVQAIVAQTLKADRSPEEFSRQFQARLMALAHTHDALTRSEWLGVSLRQQLETELQPYETAAVLEGPEVVLPPKLALPIGMVFHELATNAAKYGALSTPKGRVSVRWEWAGGRLFIEWTELGGPEVEPPTRRSFGTRLIERTLRGELNGTVGLDYRREGLRCSMQMPLEEHGP